MFVQTVNNRKSKRVQSLKSMFKNNMDLIYGIDRDSGKGNRTQVWSHV